MNDKKQQAKFLSIQQTCNQVRNAKNEGLVSIIIITETV